MRRSRPAVAGRLQGSRALGAVRLLWETSRPLSAAVGAYAVAAALLPVAVLVAAGRLVGQIPAAETHGLGSPAGQRLIVSLALTGSAYAAALALGPAQSALSSVVKWRLVHRTQDRLIAAVGEPVGIGHLEDPAVLDDLALAQGQLVNQRTADAPMTLAIVLSNRTSGLIACGVLATWRWWLGLGLLVMWVLVRRPQLRLVRAQAAEYSGASEALRRAWYLQGLVALPAVAREARVFGLGDWLTERFRSTWLAGMSTPWRLLRELDRTVLRLSLVVLAGFAGACAYLGVAAYHHEITLGTLAVMLPMLAATTSFGDISWDDVALAWMLEGLPRIDHLERSLTARPAPVAPDAPLAQHAPDAPDVPARPPRREVRFERVGFRYAPDRPPVFDGLDLRLPAGQATAIVGLNGAGKTTLVKLLARLHAPTGGRIFVDDQELSRIDPVGWQRQVAIVFQDFARYPLTLRENIAWGAAAHEDDEAGIRLAAERAGVPDRIGLDTILSRRYPGGVDLSGGQWQRVALARALFAVRHGAGILVLDEPTAWLDARGEADFFERFLQITAGTTSLIISHRFSTVRRADHICVLEAGRVRESGSHEALLADRGRYAQLFGLQAARYGEPA
jgi:ATP-binding cassette subfamily B protein